jgi:ubiquinone/menaquinone biosynthesis C-methylase UbiE
LDFLSLLERRGVSGSVLDVGCGNARNVIAFAEKGYQAYGIDISNEALKRARKHVELRNIPVDLRNGSVLNLPYPDNHFDVILDFGCLHHLRKSQWRLYLKNILRVIKDGGYYYLYCFSINTPYIPGERRPKSKSRNWVVSREMHYCHYFTYQEVQGFFGKYFMILKKYEWTKDDYPERMKVFYMRKR